MLLLAPLALGCGARTGLSEPCIITLEREKPAVVFLVRWNAACDNYRGECFSDNLFQGRDVYQVVRFTLANVVPLLDDIARIGAMPTQTIRYSERVEEPDGSREEWCATPPALTVPIGEFHGSLVERYFSLEEWPHGDGPNGPGNTLPNVPVVERALLAAGTARTPRLVILIAAGGGSPFFCPGVPDSALDLDDADYARIRAVFAGPASRGVRTLVVGMRRDTMDGWPDLRAEGILNAQAEGGGLPRADDAHYPIRFYDYADVPALEAVLRERVVAPFYCTLYATEPVPDPAAVVMIAPDAGDAPLRDPTHRDGWDFLDGTHRKIGLFGGACERTLSNPGRLSLLVRGRECG